VSYRKWDRDEIETNERDRELRIHIFILKNGEISMVSDRGTGR
jgi:hypothetical protein